MLRGVQPPWIGQAVRERGGERKPESQRARDTERERQTDRNRERERETETETRGYEPLDLDTRDTEGPSACRFRGKRQYMKGFKVVMAVAFT